MTRQWVGRLGITVFDSCQAAEITVLTTSRPKLMPPSLLTKRHPGLFPRL